MFLTLKPKNKSTFYQGTLVPKLTFYQGTLVPKLTFYQGTLVPKLTIGLFLTLSVRHGHKLKDWVFGILANGLQK